MALLRTGRNVSADNFKIQGANNGDYHILTVPENRTWLRISSEGTAASAVVNIGFRSGSAIVNFANSTLAAGEQLAFAAGVGEEIYAIVTAATATTDLTISARTG